MFEEVNKVTVYRFYEEVFNRRNTALIDELIAPEFINNDPTLVAARDRESMKQFIKTFTKAFPDHYHEIEDLIAEEDKVVMRCTFTATHKGQFPGLLEMPPTGKSIRQRQIHILRVQDGQLAEHWVVRDDLTMMQQLGLIPKRELEVV